MSEKQEKRKRLNEKMEYIAEFNAWLRKEPPRWRFIQWARWKKSRPLMERLAWYLEEQRR